VAVVEEKESGLTGNDRGRGHGQGKEKVACKAPKKDRSIDAAIDVDFLELLNEL